MITDLFALGSWSSIGLGLVLAGGVAIVLVRGLRP